MFTTEQVMQLVQKALGVGGAVATTTPGERSGGDALAQEDMKDKESAKLISTDDLKSKKKMKKCSKEMYKSNMLEILDKVSSLYPQNSRDQIWAAVKDRLAKKFPELSENEK